ncbi:MAG: hypothetical protein HFJ28_06730 [Clostridia bacterium]|nr:hypothetical protein [Clostridia bacterium]
MQKKEKVKWRKLDNSAKLFPIVGNKKFSSIYRMSVTLVEQIEPKTLKLAVEQALNIFTSFKVCLKKGFFWYYLEENQQEIVVNPEETYPCRYMNQKANHGYLFKVTYYKNKMNVEIFHALTDGSTAIEFVKTIVYEYLNLVHTNTFKEKFTIKNVEADTKNIEDSYLKNYEKGLHRKENSQKAYILKGKKLLPYQVGITHGFISLKPVLKTCRRLKVTVSEYFTAVLIYSIYQEQKEQKKSKKPIKVCIPVNLKNYFKSTTTSNFFSYMTVVADHKQLDLTDFELILAFVRNNFKNKLKKEEIAKTMAHTVRLGNSIYIRMIPLVIKKLILKLIYSQIQKYTTTTFSNLGKINFLPEYQAYIDQFFFVIGPERAEKIKCTACSYGNNIAFSFSSILKENKVEKRFFQFLEEQQIPNTVVTNGIYDKENTKLYPKINTLLIEEVIDKMKEKKKIKISIKEKIKRKFHF